MSEKFEFGSRPWREALINHIRRRVAAATPEQLRGVEFSSCEVFTDVPVHLAEDESRRIAWHFRIHDGVLECDLTELDRANSKVTADYASLIPLARMEMGTDPEAAMALAQKKIGELMAAGKFTREGNQEGRPAFLEGLHDDMAAITA